MPVNTVSRTVAACAAVLMCAATLGCSGNDETRADEVAPSEPAAETPHLGGRIAVGIESDPNGLDPTRNAWDNAGLQLANALYDPFTAFDAQGRPRPYLAESLVPNADFTKWILTLRPGVVFHDGTPVDADAAVTFVQKIRESGITGPAAKNIASVNKIDDLSFEIVMQKPWAAFPALMAGQGGYIVAPKQLESPTGQSEPNGTGPFVLKGWQKDTRFELTKNPRYWRTGLPRLDGVDFLVVDQGRDRLARIAEGTMDAAVVSRFDDSAALERELAQPTPRVTAANDTSDAEKDTFIFNTSRAPFNDVRIRRAIAHATDVEALSKAHGWPTDQAVTGPFLPGSPFYTPTQPPKPDIERAKALVREYLNDPKSNTGKRREITFTLNGTDFDTPWLQTLVAQWARAGITAKLKLVPNIQIVRLAVLGDFDVTMLRYFNAQDPDVLWHFFVSDTVADPDGPPISLNFARFKNKTITDGFNRARGTDDLEVRKQAYADVQKELAAQVPLVWLNRQQWRIITAPTVRDARNVTLPDGSPALPYLAGTYRLTETWLDR